MSDGLTVGGEFDGVGLLAYGLHLAGLEHRWLCEVDPWRRSILAKRWPGIPVFDDVRAVGSGSADRVDVIAGGFPCKGASTAGKRNGFDHPETVLWREMARTIRELRPRYVLVENVANILGLHDGAVWGEVVGDLAALGYDVTWDCLPAASVGAPHLRDRVFAVAVNTAELGRGEDEQGLRPRQSDLARPGAESVADADGAGERRDAGERREPGRRPDARGSGPAPADADRDPVRAQRQPERGRGSAAVTGRPGEAPADAARRPTGRDAEDAARGMATKPDGDHGVAVEWGEYEPAIRRWEAVHGPAPEPLVRRVDDGGARRVERSRLSALGDGVCVHVGMLAGTYIVELERRRVNG